MAVTSALPIAPFDRIVPAPSSSHSENPLDVGVEEFSEWAVDSESSGDSQHLSES